MSCILCHRGVQLILAYSWARPAILVAGKGRGGMFLFLLFLHFHSCSSFFPVPLFHLFDYLFYHSSPLIYISIVKEAHGYVKITNFTRKDSFVGVGGGGTLLYSI